VPDGFMSWIADFIREALARWGYLALAVALLGEDAGLPLPGETTLMLSSFLAHKSSGLRLGLLIAVGIAAAIVGDNLGFLVGKWLGRRLLRWMKDKFHLDEDIAVATDQIRRHGPATIFWARFIVGLRTIAGPVAGALGMEWKTFLIYNALGAVAWVTTMALAGYAFANKFDSFLGYIEKASWAVSAGVFAVGYLVWRRQKKDYKERKEAASR
jgi:membrane protein DedA with SNARE-associated domain